MKAPMEISVTYSLKEKGDTDPQIRRTGTWIDSIAISCDGQQGFMSCVVIDGETGNVVNAWPENITVIPG